MTQARAAWSRVTRSAGGTIFRWPTGATRIGNDCDCAALAEALDGAGRGSGSVFYVTVGTGIGGGLVVGGRLHGAGRPAVAEIGHLRPGLECRDAEQTVESLASGPALAHRARQRIKEILAPIRTDRRGDGGDSGDSGGDSGNADESAERRAAAEILAAFPQGATARELGPFVAAGNVVAWEVIDEALRALGWAIAQVITIVAPQVIVVGGGVALLGDRLFHQPLRRHVDAYVFPPLRGSYQILPPALGESVVVQGALRLWDAADSSK
jgi:glucokinase